MLVIKVLQKLMMKLHKLHKIIINDQRGRKAEKDRNAIFNLLPHLDKERIEALYNTLTAKEKRLVAKFFEETGAKGQS